MYIINYFFVVYIDKIQLKYVIFMLDMVEKCTFDFKWQKIGKEN